MHIKILQNYLNNNILQGIKKFHFLTFFKSHRYYIVILSAVFSSAVVTQSSMKLLIDIYQLWTNRDVVMNYQVNHALVNVDLTMQIQLVYGKNTRSILKGDSCEKIDKN